MKEMFSGKMMEIEMDIDCVNYDNLGTGDVIGIVGHGNITFGDKQMVVYINDTTPDYIGDPDNEPCDFTVKLFYNNKEIVVNNMKNDELQVAAAIAEIDVKSLEYVVWSARIVLRETYEQI